MIASNNSVRSGSQVFGTLGSQDGFTLIEVIISVVILAMVIVTIYIGIIYAETQILNNYRDRVATLLASGELELQQYYYSKVNGFRMHSGKDVVIDKLPKNKVLMGRLTIELKKDTEFAGGQLYDFRYLLVTVRWKDPGTKKERFITMREDYY
jgi:prepilin-type N-terminal cleavage/methylation domain-containing protein